MYKGLHKALGKGAGEVKGIIAQIEGKYAVVLTQDGEFRKVRAKPRMETGIEIDIDQPSEGVRNTRFLMKVTSIAAAALLALGTGYGAYCYTVPYSYVHLDINPSIELTANVYDRIIKAEALNEDGQKLLEGRNLKHEKIDEGVSDLLGEAVRKGYLVENDVQTVDAAGNAGKVTDDEPGDAAGNAGKGADDPKGTADNPGGTANNSGEGTNASGDVKNNSGESAKNAVLLTISSNSSKRSDILKKLIRDTASKELDTEKVDTEILVGETSLAQRNEAKKLGVTPGKLALIEDAMESEPELQLDELKKDSVKELLKKIQDKMAENKGKKAGTEGKNAQRRTPGSNSNNPTQTESTAVGNQGNGKDVKNQLPQDVQGARKSGTNNTGSSINANDWLRNWFNGQSKSRVQDNSTGQNNKNSNGHQTTNREEQTGKGIGSAAGNGNSKKIDEADRSTAGENASELKKEREKLRNDLLKQIEKQTKERNSKLQQQKQRNSNAGSSDKNGGKTNINRGRQKR